MLKSLKNLIGGKLQSTVHARFEIKILNIVVLQELLMHLSELLFFNINGFFFVFNPF